LALVAIELGRFARVTGLEVALVDARGDIVVGTEDFASESLQMPPGSNRLLAGGRIGVRAPATVLDRSVDLYVDADADPVERRVRQAWLSIAVIGGTALLVAAAAGSWQARQLSRPLEDLARGARQLGDGDFSARAPRSGLPEPDMVADALDSTAERLGVLVERASSFSADASHQLRTPLTALRLNIESLAYTGDRDDLVEGAIAELDRLDATITELLSLASPGVGEAIFVAAELVAERLEGWSVLAEADGRQVRFAPDRAPRVRGRPAAVGQALQVLLDNALRHGEGAITVSVSPGGGQEERWVKICVADQGPGFDARRLPPPPPADRGAGGRGLPLARSLMAAEGGSLRVERDTGHRADGARVCLLLPTARVD
jgi:signal transduction histidine kinase